LYFCYLQECYAPGENGPGGVRQEAKVLRVVKVLRILKIARILKAFKVVE
jgi:hypothetical protein